jgi:hypothetical protein
MLKQEDDVRGQTVSFIGEVRFASKLLFTAENLVILRMMNFICQL